MNKTFQIICIATLISTEVALSQTSFEKNERDSTHFNSLFLGLSLTQKTRWAKITFSPTYDYSDDVETFPIMSLYVYDIRRIRGFEDVSNDIGGGIAIGFHISKSTSKRFNIFSELEYEILKRYFFSGFGISWKSEKERYLLRIGMFQHVGFFEENKNFKYDVGVQLQFGISLRDH